MSRPDPALAVATHDADTQQLNQNTLNREQTAATPLLCPIIYSSSPAFGICVPLSACNSYSASVLVDRLARLGAEILAVRDANRCDITHARVETHTITHVIYNKSYSEEEMSRLAPSSSSSDVNFHAGHDLNSLLSLGEVIWESCDHDACLADEMYPNLSFFADVLGQLDPAILDRYRQFVKRSQINISATSPPPPPPPPSPPNIPPPPADTNTASVDTRPFKVVSWNILSADYAHPKTFFYCNPEELLWSSRAPQILSHLAAEDGDIECLQEMDYDPVVDGTFDSPAHESVYLRRPQHKRDGLLIRWKSDVFELCDLPPMHVLDARFAKHATDRRKDTLAFRVATKDGVQTTLQPRVKKVKTNVDTTTTTQPPTVDPPVDDSDSPLVSGPLLSTSKLRPVNRAKNLMKRQSHILTTLESLEQRVTRLEGLLAHKDGTRSKRKKNQQCGGDERCKSPPPPSSNVNQQPASRSSKKSQSDVTAGIDVAPTVDSKESHLCHSALRHFHALHFNDLSLLTRSKSNSSSNVFGRYQRSNIGLMVLLKHRHSNHPTSHHHPNASGMCDDYVLIVNVHLFWSPEFEDVKKSQTQLTLQQIEEMLRLLRHEDELQGRTKRNIHVILVGDFNSTPKSQVYQLLTRGTTKIHTPIYQPTKTREEKSNPTNNVEHNHDAASGDGSNNNVTIVSSAFHDIVFERSTPADSTPVTTTGEITNAASANDSANEAGDIDTMDEGIKEELTPVAAIDAPASDSERSNADQQPIHPPSQSLPICDRPLPRFLLDSTLLKLTKWLRALGFDTVCLEASSSDVSQIPKLVDEFFTCAKREDRIILTQNKALLKRRGCPPNHRLLEGKKDPLELFQIIKDMFSIEWNADMFYQRCTTCNHLVRQLTLEEYGTFPFLPVDYRTGLNDDLESLFLTQCTGSTCQRVRWWSSNRQKRTREKLFQARLDLEVQMTEDEGDQLDEEEQENGTQAGSDDGTGVDGADDDGNHPGLVPPSTRSVDPPTAGRSSPSSSPSLSSPPPSKKAVPDFVVPTDPTSIAAARAARKLAKAESKGARAANAAARRAHNVDKYSNCFLSRTASALVNGADGEYLFDLRPFPESAQAMQMHSQQVAIRAAAADAAALAAAPASSPSTGPMESSSAALVVDSAAPPPLPALSATSVIDSTVTGAAGSLWWTHEKKLKMIQVERRIIAETKRTLERRRREREEKRRQRQENKEHAVTSGNDATNRTDTVVSSSLASPPAPSFASHLHQYWQSAIDRSLVADGIDCHTHSLHLSSAYGQHSAEPEFTNFTPNFIDCIDYIFSNPLTLQCIDLGRMPTKADNNARGLIGWPHASSGWPSDHQLLAATFRIRSTPTTTPPASHANENDESQHAPIAASTIATATDVHVPSASSQHK